MHLHLKSLSFFSATLLLSLVSPLTIKSNLLASIASAQVQTQTSQDRKAEADRLYQEGIQLLRQRQLEQAAEKFQQVLAIREELKDSSAYWRARYHLGSIYEQLGQRERAQQYYRKEYHPIDMAVLETEESSETERLIAEEQAQIAQDIKDQADRLYQEGIQLLKQGQLQQAQQAFQQVIDILKELNINSDDRKALFQISSIYEQLGQNDRAEEYYEKASPHVDRLEARTAELNTTALRDDDEDLKSRVERLFREGLQQLQSGELQAALWTFKEVAAIRKQLGDRTGEGQAFLQLAKVHERLGQNNWAQQYYRRARERGVR